MLTFYCTSCWCELAQCLARAGALYCHDCRDDRSALPRAAAGDALALPLVERALPSVAVHASAGFFPPEDGYSLSDPKRLAFEGNW